MPDEPHDLRPGQSVIVQHDPATDPANQPQVRRAGSAKGQIWIADDFDAPLEDFKDYM